MEASNFSDSPKKGGESVKLECPDCGASMELRISRHGKFYGCTRYPKCFATHGAHSDGRPLGRPASKETKQWRIKAHDAFDLLWKPNPVLSWSGKMKRKEAYRWMRNVMNLPEPEAHIGMFTKEQCKQLIEKVYFSMKF